MFGMMNLSVCSMCPSMPVIKLNCRKYKLVENMQKHFTSQNEVHTKKHLLCSMHIAHVSRIHIENMIGQLPSWSRIFGTFVRFRSTLMFILAEFNKSVEQNVINIHVQLRSEKFTIHQIYDNCHKQ